MKKNWLLAKTGENTRRNTEVNFMVFAPPHEAKHGFRTELEAREYIKKRYNRNLEVV